MNEIKKHRKILKQSKYNWIIDLQNNMRSLLLSAGLSKELYKYKKNRLSRYLFVKFKSGQYVKNKKRSVSDKYIDSIREKLTITHAKDVLVKIEKEEIKKLQNTYKFFNNGKLTVFIYPGAKHFTKIWPLTYYNQLVEKIQLTNRWNVVLAGDKHDAVIISKMHCLSISDVYNLSGKHSIKETMQLTSLCKLVISNDSAPMHVAAIFKIPQISIWGNTVEQFGFFPINPNSRILQNNSIECRPCSHIGFKQCPKEHFKCMRDIDVDSVFNTFLEMAENNK
ncbi:MAG: glycosyltransferase family 9 protein [Calditrichia bacterium]|nr:glycosyltransferase family 9 protein [Calditrichia bacterium]